MAKKPILLRILLLSGLFTALCPAISNGDDYPDKLGYGRFATGGEGGKVYTIMTLADEGPGSFREAATSTGRRIIRFGVSGQINLESGEVNIPGDVTIDGTGVTFSRSRLHMIGDNFIVRNVRSRPGNEYPGQYLTSRDGLSIGFADQDTVSTGIIDRCSFSWASDENLSTWRAMGPSSIPAVRDITLSRNIIAECLQDAGHIHEGTTTTNPHSMGLLVGDSSTRVTVFGNLFVSNDYRHPMVKVAQEIEVINNFSFNYGPGGMRFTGDYTTGIAINNVFIPGANSPDPDTRSAIVVDAGLSSATYLSGNHVWSEGDWKVDWNGGSGTPVAEPPFPGSGLVPMPWDQVEAYVLANAGARSGNPARLDEIDQYFVDYVVARQSKEDPPDNPFDSYDYLEDYGPAPLWDPVPMSIYAPPPSFGLRTGGMAQLSVGVGGSFVPDSYQWFHDGSPIEGATDDTYVISSFSADQAGTYTVEVTFGEETLISEPGYVYEQLTYDEWMEAAGIPAGEREPDFVSTKFGIPNIVAYAFHLNADEIAPLWQVKVSPIPSEKVGIRISLERPPTTTNLDWKCETSADMESWSDPETITDPVSDAPDELVFDLPGGATPMFARPSVTLQQEVVNYVTEVFEDFEDNDLWDPWEWFPHVANRAGSWADFIIVDDANPPEATYALKINYGYESWQYAYFGGYNNPTAEFGGYWKESGAVGLRVTLKGDATNQLTTDGVISVQLREGSDYERWTKWLPSAFFNTGDWFTVDILWKEFEESGGGNANYTFDLELMDQIRFYCFKPGFETVVYVSRIELLYPDPGE